MIAQLAAGRDGHGGSQRVERDGMRRSQNLKRSDTGDHSHGHVRQSGRDTQGAVVKRRVAPDHQRDVPLLRQALGDGVTPDAGDGIMPVVHRPKIVRLISPQRHIILCHGDRRGQNLRQYQTADIGKVGLVLTLAWQQDQVGAVQRARGLSRQMVRVAGADADDGKRDHGPML